MNFENDYTGEDANANGYLDYNEIVLTAVHIGHYKNNQEPINYRPISLLPTLGKTFEKLLNITLTNFLEQNKSIDLEQSGFRQNRTTLDNIIRAVEIGKQAINAKNACLMVALYIKKAFDTVSIEGLKYRLQEHNIPNILIRWLFSYLDNREIKIIYENVITSSLQPLAGVPQGSCLSARKLSISLIYK